MGCDIHINVEVKDNKGKWHWIYEGVKKWQSAMGAFDLDRNYTLFGLLAGIRGDNKPFIEPRGLPKDVSPEVQKMFDKGVGNWHTGTWLTVKELKKIDWKQKIDMEGCVDAENYKVYKQKGSPDCWSSMSGGQLTIEVSNADMDKVLKMNTEQMGDIYFYTYIKWKESLEQACGYSIQRLISQIGFLDSWDEEWTKRTESTVRIVFWFDN